MSALAFFYHPELPEKAGTVALTEETARHLVQVLRKTTGDQLLLTDGKGKAAEATIIDTAKKRCTVRIDAVVLHPAPAPQLHIAVSFTKNTARNEWLLEKLTEMGVTGIVPVVSKRTERERMRLDRWQNILISAMLQSQQYHLPVLHEPMDYTAVIKQFTAIEQRLIAHCMEGKERTVISKALLPQQHTIVLIGPEGDFTPEEVTLAEEHTYKAISLGNTRLRTETAAMSVCSFFNMINA